MLRENAHTELMKSTSPAEFRRILMSDTFEGQQNPV